jgi:hypothetical protein
MLESFLTVLLYLLFACWFLFLASIILVSALTVIGSQPQWFNKVFKSRPGLFGRVSKALCLSIVIVAILLGVIHTWWGK